MLCVEHALFASAIFPRKGGRPEHGQRRACHIDQAEGVRSSWGVRGSVGEAVDCDCKIGWEGAFILVTSSSSVRDIRAKSGNEAQAVQRATETRGCALQAKKRDAHCKLGLSWRILL